MGNRGEPGVPEQPARDQGALLEERASPALRIWGDEAAQEGGSDIDMQLSTTGLRVRAVLRMTKPNGEGGEELIAEAYVQISQPQEVAAWLETLAASNVIVYASHRRPGGGGEPSEVQLRFEPRATGAT